MDERQFELLMQELRTQTVLLMEIRDAFLPEPPEEIPMEDACKCMRAGGSPVANCPLCKGTGLA